MGCECFQQWVWFILKYTFASFQALQSSPKSIRRKYPTRLLHHFLVCQPCVMNKVIVSLNELCVGRVTAVTVKPCRGDNCRNKNDKLCSSSARPARVSCWWFQPQVQIPQHTHTHTQNNDPWLLPACTAAVFYVYLWGPMGEAGRTDMFIVALGSGAAGGHRCRVLHEERFTVWLPWRGGATLH